MAAAAAKLEMNLDALRIMKTKRGARALHKTDKPKKNRKKSKKKPSKIPTDTKNKNVKSDFALWSAAATAAKRNQKVPPPSAPPPSAAYPLRALKMASDHC